MAIVYQPSSGVFCGGTLVASKYVVTAAHCAILDNTIVNPRLIKVRQKIKKKMIHVWSQGETRGT